MFYFSFFLVIILVSLICIKPVKKYNDDYLSYQSTLRAKGLSAIWIMIHHLSQHVEYSYISQILGGSGISLCSIISIL